MKDLWLKSSCRRGSWNDDVALVQEWLGLRGRQVAIDGVFGPATEAAVRSFQRTIGVPATGVVDDRTFRWLTGPMLRALQPIPADQQSLGQLVVAYARQHWLEHPCEIGGQNKGPWVRLYMNGHEGANCPWCAGFVSFVIGQACDAMGRSRPFPSTVSCDELARSASRAGLIVGEAEVVAGKRIQPGSIFLVRATPSDWTHTGIVVEAASESFETIEGNTNDDGCREGYEVCQRTRGYGSKDFIVFA